MNSVATSAKGTMGFGWTAEIISAQTRQQVAITTLRADIIFGTEIIHIISDGLSVTKKRDVGGI